jgi:hypothetical protein
MRGQRCKTNTAHIDPISRWKAHQDSVVVDLLTVLHAVPETWGRPVSARSGDPRRTVPLGEGEEDHMGISIKAVLTALCLAPVVVAAQAAEAPQDITNEVTLERLREKLNPFEPQAELHQRVPEPERFVLY